MKEQITTDNIPDQIELPTEMNHTGRRLGTEEVALLRQVIESGTLNCTRGTMVKRLEQEFARHYAPDHRLQCFAVTSGTAAIHTAIAALNLEPGDEIVTTPVTDMGALTPIIFQCCIPIFADMDPYSFNITAESIERVLSPRTRAIIVTHLFGTPCDMDPILELAARHGLPVIEDAAQAPYALYKGRRVGTMGTIGCFSLQQCKHITCGEGGLIVTSDEQLARRMSLFHDKGWGYGDEHPDHYFLALNYRMTELQGAVVLAQLEKVDNVVRCRQRTAARFTEQIADLPGIVPQQQPPETQSVYWKYVIRVEAQAGADVREIAAFLLAHYNIQSSPCYVKKPAFECRIFRERNTFGNSQFPYQGLQRADLPQIEYHPENYPGAYDALEHMLVLPWNENYTDQHVDYIALALRHAVT